MEGVHLSSYMNIREEVVSIEEKVNRNNLARAAIACKLHNYQPPIDKISSCKNCGMQIIILEELPTPEHKVKE